MNPFIHTKINCIFHFVSSSGKIISDMDTIRKWVFKDKYIKDDFFYIHFDIVYRLSIKNVEITTINFDNKNYRYNHMLVNIKHGTSDKTLLVTMNDFLKTVYPFTRPDWQVDHYDDNTGDLIKEQCFIVFATCKLSN